MRISRLAIALSAVACAVALPATAAAHQGKPSNHGHKGKGDNGAVTRLSPVGDSKAKGAASFTQHTGALSVALGVARLTPSTFYQAHIHSGTCATTPAGAVSLGLPDIYADEDGVAKLVTTLPDSVDHLAGGFYIDVEYAGKVVACGDIKAKTQKAASETRIKGANHERGRAELFQKGSDISGWIKIKGLTPGAHAVQIHAGTCAAPTGAAVATLGDVTADADGNAFAKLTGTAVSLVVGKNFTVDVNANPVATVGATIVACGDQHPARWKHGGHGHFGK